MKSLHIAFLALAAVLFQHGCHQATAQAVHPKSTMGVVTELRYETMELVMKTEEGNSVVVKCSRDTEFLSVPAGVHDLSKAMAANPHDIAVGDHVLASFVDGMTEARRL